MSQPAKITVERAGETDPNIIVQFRATTFRISEDTAMTLGRALQMVATSEKPKLTVYEETSTRPAGMYA